MKRPTDTTYGLVVNSLTHDELQAHKARCVANIMRWKKIRSVPIAERFGTISDAELGLFMRMDNQLLSMVQYAINHLESLDTALQVRHEIWV